MVSQRLNLTVLGCEDQGKRGEKHSVYCAVYFSCFASFALFKSSMRCGTSLSGMKIYLLTVQFPFPVPMHCLHGLPPIVAGSQGCRRKAWLCNPQPTCFLCTLCRNYSCYKQSCLLSASTPRPKALGKSQISPTLGRTCVQKEETLLSRSLRLHGWGGTGWRLSLLPPSPTFWFCSR